MFKQGGSLPFEIYSALLNNLREVAEPPVGISLHFTWTAAKFANTQGRFGMKCHVGHVGLSL